jgi:N-glycosidase YbiA
MQETYPLEKFFIYFSPYTAHVVEVLGVLYPTVEHAYQCQRYTDKEIIEEIRSARSPVKAWEASSKYKHLQIPEFKKEEYKLEVMKKLMRLKAEQHEEIRKALVESGDLNIVKHITTYPPGDGFWDDGEDGKGQNHMGRMWMEIREELVTQSGRI